MYMDFRMSRSYASTLRNPFALATLWASTGPGVPLQDTLMLGATRARKRVSKLVETGHRQLKPGSVSSCFVVSATTAQSHFGVTAMPVATKTAPNPSVEATHNGIGPQGAVVHHAPRGPMPSRAPHLQR